MKVHLLDSSDWRESEYKNIFCRTGKTQLLLNRTVPTTTIPVLKSSKLTVESETRKEASWGRQRASGNDKTFILSLFQGTWRWFAPGANQPCLHALFYPLSRCAVCTLVTLCHKIFSSGTIVDNSGSLGSHHSVLRSRLPS